MYQIDSFLKQISEINKRYDEAAKLSGENFNVFQILGLSSDELSHSSFLATMLNPKGSHEQGELFLELFLEEIKINEFTAKNSTVETEKFIGEIDPNFENGGRIDIVITESNPNKQIFIENKIYAGDQEKQLFRYSKNNKNAVLIYLTLYGTDASEASLGKLKPEDYLRVSYRENILNWLEKCKKESAGFPLLRETISQYIFLIKKLTGQSRSKLMEKEIIEIIMSDNKNIESAFIISNNINKLKKEIIHTKLLPYLEIKYSNSPYNMKFTLKNDKYLSAYWGFSFEKEEWKNIKIQFEFEAGDLQNLIYGFCRKDSKVDLPDHIKNLNQSGKYKTSKAWPLYSFMSKYKDWDKDVFVLLSTNHDKDNDVFLAIESKINELLDITKGMEL